MGLFTRVLREAQILDNRAINSTGAAVVLPYGVELFDRFRATIHTAYHAARLAEHEYPHVVPLDVAAPSGALIDLRDRLLLVGTESEIAERRPPFVLAPSGEMVIYSHWSRAVTSRADLPIRMYRRARYFRPVSRGAHSGRGVFHTVEHDDIFEFHCAHAKRSDQQHDLALLQAMVTSLIDDLKVPVLWSTRPPWTNRAQIAGLVVAADAPLPLHLTAQLACLYDQGTRFSRLYNVGFRESGQTHHAEQLTGYVSRRLLMAHLMLGLWLRGSLFIHPDHAPVQILMLVRDEHGYQPNAPAALLSRLRERGVRVREIRPQSAVALTRTRKLWAPRGVPMTIQCFAPRAANDRWKVVVGRGDIAEELVVYPDDPGDLADELHVLLFDIADSFEAGVSAFARSRVRATGRKELLEVLDQRLIAICSLAVGEQPVRAIAELRKGEVLGYCQSNDSQPCIVTGEPVTTVAFISPRL